MWTKPTLFPYTPPSTQAKTAPTNQFHVYKSVIQDYFSCLFMDLGSELVNLKDPDLDNDEAEESSITQCACPEGEDG